MGTEYKSKKELDEEDWERYRKKQEAIFERKKAKFEAEGFKCRTEGCGKSFKDFIEWQVHVTKHQDDLKASMICNQAKCGKKFDNRKAYNEHCESHKKELKLRIENSIRAVLMYNKHGLLFEVFEQEFRGMIGKPIPYKFFGFNCVYDLLVSWPEVVEVTHLGGGQALLIGVPDKNTEHIAKMVGNQRDTREGFNRRTGEVLARVGGDIIHKIEKASGRKSRIVPEFMKKQIEQLMEMEMFETGLYLCEFQQVYDQEYGYPLDFRCYGFYNLEDFCFNGLQGSAEMELDGSSWKLVPIGYKRSDIGGHPIEISSDVRNNIKKLLGENPYGLSEHSFIRSYESCFGQLNLRQLRCKDLVELCCLLPDCCVATMFGEGEVTVLPAGGVRENYHTSPLLVLGEVKNNILHLLRSHPAGVTLDCFVKGYEGYYGYLPLLQLGCGDVMELCRAATDVCKVRLSEPGECVIAPVNKENPDANIDIDGDNVVSNNECDSVPESVVSDVRRVLQRQVDGIKVSSFPEVFLETVGENIDPGKFGFDSLVSLFRHLPGTVVKISDCKEDPTVKLMEGKVELLGQSVLGPHFGIGKLKIKPGWVNVLSLVSTDLLCVQMEEKRKELEEMEEMMEHFYTRDVAGQKVDPGNLVVGLPVAALYIDMAWHRGVVVGVRQEMGMVEIEYKDWGWRACVRSDTVRGLDARFGHLPGQSVMVLCREMKMDDGEVNWEQVVMQGRGKGRVVRGEKGQLFIDLFKRCSSKGQDLCSQGSAMNVGPQSAVMVKSSTGRTNKLNDGSIVNQDMIVSSLARIRERERLSSV